MVTIKQVEAMYWVEKLGSFHAAADQLNTSQSSISKRIKELELTLGVDVFIRTKSSVQMTLKGREILGDCGEMLVLNQRILNAAKGSNSFSGEFNLGVTEMVALTWLPQLIRAIKDKFPNITLKTTVDLTERMVEKFSVYRLDLALCPAGGFPTASRFSSLWLSKLESAWMCSPDLAESRNGELSVEDLRNLPMLTFAEGSLLSMAVSRALGNHGVIPQQTISCSSMIALAGLVRQGLGVAYLPRDYFLSFGSSGEMIQMKAPFTIEPLEYSAIYQDDFIGLQIAELARHYCDFSRPDNRRTRSVAIQA